MKLTVCCVAAVMVVWSVSACGPDDEVAGPVDAQGLSDSTGDRSLDTQPRGLTLLELTDALVGRRWVLVEISDKEPATALRPTIWFAAAEDGGWMIGGYEGCNWWSSFAAVEVGADGATVHSVGPFESTAMACPYELDPAPRGDVTYAIEMPDAGVLVLSGPGVELRYIDLHAVDGIRPIAPDDLSESWRFVGVDNVELVAADAGPTFRYGNCTTPIDVSSDGHLRLDSEPDWLGCGHDPVGSHIGPIDEVLVDASGRERTPRSVKALVTGDAMYLLGLPERGQVYQLERLSDSTPPPSDQPPSLSGPTTDPVVEALTTPDYSSSSFVALAAGEVQPTQVWAWCSVSIEVGENRYLADREIVPNPGREWRDSDFPHDWDVVVFNDAPQDGPSWAMLDAKVVRIDATSLEVRHIGTDELIAYFLLDDTPTDQRIC